MLVYRLVQAAYRQEPLSGQGAALYGGRWNPKGLSLLYTTESPALSLVEVLVHINPKYIPAYYLVTIEVPDSIRAYRADELPDEWRATGSVQPLPSQTFLLDWLRTPDTSVSYTHLDVYKRQGLIYPLSLNSFSFTISVLHTLYLSA